MDYGCIKLLSVYLRLSVRFLQHLHSSWVILLQHCSSLVNWAVLVIEPTYLSLVYAASWIAQTLRWPSLCIGHVVIILSFFHGLAL